MMRMGTWLQHVQLRDNAGLAEQWLYGNRSVLGGLVGAWLGVHVAKRLVGYRLRTGDLFAPAVALGMAVGRVGCLLTERPGHPDRHVVRHHPGRRDGRAARRPRRRAAAPVVRATRSPSTLVGLRCCCGSGCVAGASPPATTFVLYVAAYGVFRFLVEFVRGNEVAWHGLTRPQSPRRDRPDRPGPRGRAAPATA